MGLLCWMLLLRIRLRCLNVSLLFVVLLLRRVDLGVRCLLPLVVLAMSGLRAYSGCDDGAGGRTLVTRVCPHKMD